VNKLTLASALALALLPASSRPQASVEMQVHLGLPPRPLLVEVQPGVRVVTDFQEEVFLYGGAYWLRRDALWYRAPRPGVVFVHVEPPRVPPGLLRLPPGHYRHYPMERAKAERRAWKDHEKAERKAWKAQHKAEKQAWKKRGGGDHGHGKHGE